MRLIDANELKKEFPHDEDWDFPVNTNGYVVETINRMPTVDAIPVEFIEKLMKEFGDYEESWNLRGLIEDWRKENESNISD